MASLYRRPKSPNWWIKFRDHEGKVARVSAGTENKTDAQSLAEELEESAAIALRGKSALRDGALRRLIELGYLAAEEDLPPPPVKDPLKIEALALSHPTVARERRTRPGDHNVHLAHLRTFIDATGAASIHDLTGPMARAYLDRLVNAGMTKEQIRHRLLYLRAAAGMAVEYGIPNPIAILRIPRQTAPAVSPRALDLATAREVVATCKSPRMRLGMALMLCLGLRLSEACRLQWRDLAGDVLHVGSREAKTAASDRLLPVAPLLLALLEDWRAHRLRVLAKKGLPPTDLSPVILTRWHSWQGDQLEPRAVGRTIAGHLPQDYLTKDLRRTFATVATWELSIPAEVVEAFLGRRVSSLGTVTARHYLAKPHVDRLRPHAIAVAEAILGTPTRHTVSKSKSARPVSRPSKP